jgi:hypothetical protein
MIDLQTFCIAKDSGRYSLESPFSRGDWTYATNGHIAVRVPRRADVDEGSTSVERLGWAPSNATYVSAPRFELPRSPEVDCEKCDGRGTKHDCPGCSCKCEHCDGTAVEPEKFTVGIGEGIFSAKFLRLILGLPGVELGPIHSREPMPFRFEGGEGLLMPMRGKSEHHVDVDLTAPASAA